MVFQNGDAGAGNCASRGMSWISRGAYQMMSMYSALSTRLATLASLERQSRDYPTFVQDPWLAAEWRLHINIRE